MATTLASVLHQGNEDALVVAGGGPRISRSKLTSLVHDTAARLIAAGIKPGAVVSMAYHNTVDFVVAFLAVTHARAVAAPLNSAYKVDEHRFYLGDTSAALLLLPAEGNAAAQEAARALNVPVATLTLEAGATIRITPLTGNLAFPAPGQRTLPEPPRPADVALFLHTSGTTGRPKGVPLSHANLAASLANIRDTYDLTASDVSYLVMPLFHVHGLMAGLLSPLLVGARVVFPAAGRFTASTFWADCVAHGATFYTAVPTIHQVLLARAKQDYPASNPPPLRFIRSCSSALAPATLEALEATFKVPVLEAYAMTEASHQMTSNPLPHNGPRKPGTVGRAQGGVSVGILDQQNRVLGPRTIGEVCVRGSNVTAGYLNNPKANEEAFAGGWFHTGDQGFIDEQGYVTLTGRIKELINRGGEKISPLEVDAVLLAHHGVAEAVSFGAPDAKYGETVAAAVVLKPGVSEAGLEADIRAHCAKTMAAFKVPDRIFFTKVLPKTATGKIQRRHMVAAFIKPGDDKQAAPGAPASPSQGHTSTSSSHTAGLGDGYEVAVRALQQLGVKYMFGVVGIPVTPLASSAQAVGIRFIAMRNEQAAGYAAAAAGYLTGTPAVLLTVSGPGAIHGIAGLSHATANCWPLIMLSGSCEQGEVGKGAFQEEDQVAAVSRHVKYAGRADRLADIPTVIAAAYAASVAGRPGAAYVDIPSNILMTRLPGGSGAQEALAKLALPPVQRPRPSACEQAVQAAAQLLRGAARPLLVVGKGAAQARAEEVVQVLANRYGIPVLGTAMGRGCVPDDHPLCANAARSLALGEADVAVVVGARLNWQLHFGEAPRWAQGVKFVLVDVAPGARDASLASVVLRGDARVALGQLAQALQQAPGVDTARYRDWVARLQAKSRAAGQSVAKKIAAAPSAPLDYYGVLGVVRDMLLAQQPAPIVVSEGANTMDMSRLLLPVKEPRTRLDAGTWGTMGVGPGSAIAAAVCCPGRLVVAVEGDSAFGFSGMEVETLVRYKLPVVVIVMNNGGIYGGDRRESALARAAEAGAQGAGFGSDPIPTAFVHSRHDALMAAFGGSGRRAASLAELREQLAAAVHDALHTRQPCLLDVILDPLAGVESGNVHAFNAPKPKL